MTRRFGALARLNGHEFGSLNLADFNQGIGQKGAEHYAWIGGPSRALGIKFGGFKGKALFVDFNRLLVSSGFVENYPDIVQRRKSKGRVRYLLRNSARGDGGLHRAFMFSDSPEGDRKLTVHSSIAQRIPGGIGEAARFAQHIGDQAMFAQRLQRNYSY